MAGLYVHIPFCASRCIYCDFYSTTLSNLRHDYINALCREMDLRKNYFTVPIGIFPQVIKTIYVGGGTPSQLTEKEFNSLFCHIRKTFGDSAEEITVEVNPDDVTDGLVSTLVENGVNRVSMGAQTFDDSRLRFLHRRHCAMQVDKAIYKLRNAGITNISIDLMFGFPNESVDSWEQDIDHAVDLSPNHISGYSLMYEEGTALWKMKERGMVKAIDDDTSLKMYEILIDKLCQVGYEHYEISNFTKPGFRSIHNSSYWNDTPYIGLGAAAHSYNRKSRQWNVADVRKYIRSIGEGKIPATIERIDERTHYNDLVTTELRTSEGICLDSLQKKFREFLMENSLQYINEGLMETNGSYLKITRKGLYISDAIMSDMVMV